MMMMTMSSQIREKMCIGRKNSGERLPNWWWEGITDSWMGVFTSVVTCERPFEMDNFENDRFIIIYVPLELHIVICNRFDDARRRQTWREFIHLFINTKCFLWTFNKYIIIITIIVRNNYNLQRNKRTKRFLFIRNNYNQNEFSILNFRIILLVTLCDTYNTID